MSEISRVCMVATSLFILSGCANHQEVLPTLAINGAHCQSTFFPATPITLKFDPTADAYTALKLTTESLCHSSAAGEPDLYIVASLPQTEGRYVLIVTALPEDNSLLAPSIALLDAQGSITRELAADKFMFRGAGLTGLIQPRQDERFLVISSDHKLVGQTSSRLLEAVDVRTTYTPMFRTNTYIGSEQHLNRTFSYTGVLSVITSPILQQN